MAMENDAPPQPVGFVTLKQLPSSVSLVPAYRFGTSTNDLAAKVKKEPTSSPERQPQQLLNSNDKFENSNKVLPKIKIEPGLSTTSFTPNISGVQQNVTNVSSIFPSQDTPTSSISTTSANNSLLKSVKIENQPNNFVVLQPPSNSNLISGANTFSHGQMNLPIMFPVGNNATNSSQIKHLPYNMAYNQQDFQRKMFEQIRLSNPNIQTNGIPSFGIQNQMLPNFQSSIPRPNMPINNLVLNSTLKPVNSTCDKIPQTPIVTVKAEVNSTQPTILPNIGNDTLKAGHPQLMGGFNSMPIPGSFSNINPVPPHLPPIPPQIQQQIQQLSPQLRQAYMQQMQMQYMQMMYQRNLMLANANMPSNGLNINPMVMRMPSPLLPTPTTPSIIPSIHSLTTSQSNINPVNTNLAYSTLTNVEPPNVDNQNHNSLPNKSTASPVPKMPRNSSPILIQPPQILPTSNCTTTISKPVTPIVSPFPSLNTSKVVNLPQESLQVVQSTNTNKTKLPGTSSTSAIVQNVDNGSNVDVPSTQLQKLVVDNDGNTLMIPGNNLKNVTITNVIPTKITNKIEDKQGKDQLNRNNIPVIANPVVTNVNQLNSHSGPSLYPNVPPNVMKQMQLRMMLANQAQKTGVPYLANIPPGNAPRYPMAPTLIPNGPKWNPNQQQQRAGVIICMGATLNKGGINLKFMQALMIYRCQVAVKLHQLTGFSIVVIGGSLGVAGANENSTQAMFMKEFILKSLSIDQQKIIMEEESTSTIDKCINAVKIIDESSEKFNMKDGGRIALVTSFHNMPRTSYLMKLALNQKHGSTKVTSNYHVVECPSPIPPNVALGRTLLMSEQVKLPGTILPQPTGLLGQLWRKNMHPLSKQEMRKAVWQLNLIIQSAEMQSNVPPQAIGSTGNQTNNVATQPPSMINIKSDPTISIGQALNVPGNSEASTINSMPGNVIADDNSKTYNSLLTVPISTSGKHDPISYQLISNSNNDNDDKISAPATDKINNGHDNWSKIKLKTPDLNIPFPSTTISLSKADGTCNQVQPPIYNFFNFQPIKAFSSTEDKVDTVGVADSLATNNSVGTIQGYPENALEEAIRISDIQGNYDDTKIRDGSLRESENENEENNSAQTLAYAYTLTIPGSDSDFGFSKTSDKEQRLPDIRTAFNNASNEDESTTGHANESDSDSMTRLYKKFPGFVDQLSSLSDSPSKDEKVSGIVDFSHLNPVEPIQVTLSYDENKDEEVGIGNSERANENNVTVPNEAYIQTTQNFNDGQDNPNISNQINYSHVIENYQDNSQIFQVTNDNSIVVANGNFNDFTNDTATIVTTASSTQVIEDSQTFVTEPPNDTLKSLLSIINITDFSEDFEVTEYNENNAPINTENEVNISSIDFNSGTAIMDFNNNGLQDSNYSLPSTIENTENNLIQGVPLMTLNIKQFPKGIQMIPKTEENINSFKKTKYSEFTDDGRTLDYIPNKQMKIESNEKYEFAMREEVASKEKCNKDPIYQKNNYSGFPEEEFKSLKKVEQLSNGRMCDLEEGWMPTSTYPQIASDNIFISGTIVTKTIEERRKEREKNRGLTEKESRGEKRKRSPADAGGNTETAVENNNTKKERKTKSKFHSKSKTDNSILDRILQEADQTV